MITWPPEELLWESRRAGVDRREAGPIPSKESLRSYRAGGLSDIGRRRLEWTLARNVHARERLCEIAGVERVRPPKRVRRRVLGGQRVLASYWPLAAAVVLAGAMISAAILLQFPGVDAEVLPADLAFDVRVEGLAATRAGAGLARALPETPIRITVEPRAFGVDGLEFALYVPRDGQLLRLEPGPDLVVASSRGAARLVVSARALAGTVPGLHEIFVVVSRRGSLPGELAIEEAIAASAAGEALVYRQTIEIIGPGDPALRPGGEP